MENKIFNKEMECMTRRELEALQLERLKSLVDYCERNSEFYSKRLAKAGVTADKIKTLSDIQYIPYTTKDDLISLCTESYVSHHLVVRLVRVSKEWNLLS